jgi:membrane protein YqaA with SNARE-associated domain
VKTIGRWLSLHILPLGAPGLFLLALADSAIVPIPEGVDVLLFAQVTRRPAAALLYATLATLGSLLGCLFLYYVSRAAGEIALARHVSPQGIDRMRRQFEKYEALTLVLPSMIPLPLPMKLFVIAAGVFEVHFGFFLLAILFGRVVRYYSLALVAQRYGPGAWTFLRQNVMLAGFIAAALIAGFYWFSRRMAVTTGAAR